MNPHFALGHAGRSLFFGLGLALFLLALPAPVRSALLRGLTSHPALVAMLAAFGLLTLSLLWSAGQRLDAWLFLSLNLRGSRPQWLDWAMLAVTQLGSNGATLAAALLLLWIHPQPLAYQLILGTLTLWILVELLKALVQRRRPYARLAEARVVGRPEAGRSFPSGHTSQIFFVATLLTHHLGASGGLPLLLYATAALVAVTRSYVGAHYPRDLLAGATLGTIWGLLGVVLDESWPGGG